MLTCRRAEKASDGGSFDTHGLIHRVQEAVGIDRVTHEGRPLQLAPARVTLRLVDHRAVLNRHQHVNLVELLRVDRGGIVGEDHEVGDLTGLDRSFAILLSRVGRLNCQGHLHAWVG